MRTYVLDRNPENLRGELGTGAGDVARIVSEIRDRVEVELRPASDPEDDRWRLLQAVAAFLRNASSTQPILLILEDLHWSDRGTLDLLVHLARNLQGARLLIVGTYRDVEVDRAHPLSSTLAELRRASSFGRVTLRGLTPDEVHRMMNNLAGQEVRWALAEAVYRQTEGNPLFIQEMLRYIVEEGMVTRQDGQWQRAGDTPLEMIIPEGLRDVIGKRLSRLSAECNRLLMTAAVIGRDFDLGTLSKVVSSDEESTLTSLEEAVRIAVLEERSQVGGVRYRFTHAFFRQTLYEETGAARRIRLHQQVGKALEEQYRARLTEHAAELAEHFSHSSDPADLAKAVEYGEIAAQRAVSVFDYGEAVRLLERAIDVQEVLDHDDKAARCDLLLALGEALIPAGEPLRAAEMVAETALVLAETLGDGKRAVEACGIALDGLFRYGGSVGESSAFAQWAERADRHAEPGTVARVRADISLGLARNRTSWREGKELLSRALELARQLDDQDILYQAALRHITGVSPQCEEERFSLAKEFTTRPHEKVSISTLGRVLWNSATVYLNHGERARAEELWRQVEELATRTREPFIALFPPRNEIFVATLDGHLEAAVQLGQRFVNRAEELGSSAWGRRFANRETIVPLLWLGRADGVLTTLPEGAGGEGDHQMASDRVLILAHLGRMSEARDALGQLLARWNIGPEEDETPSNILTKLLEAAVLVENREAASLLAQRLAGLASMTTVDTCIARHLGAAAVLLGERERAKAYYQQALEVCAKVRFRPEIALTRLQLAELLLEEAEDARRSQGRGDLAPTGDVPDVGDGSPAPTASRLRRAEDIYREALEHLDFAIAEFQEMKMQPSLERALRHKGLLKA